MQIRAGLALINDDLSLYNDVCIEINDEGIIETISKASTCNKYLGNKNLIAIPQPANSHVHSGDNNFPEYGIDKDLHELVAYPDGLKHKLLNSLSYDDLVKGISLFYKKAYNMGIGLIADFREGGGIGCKASKEASKGIKYLDIITLGRPGKEFPNNCDGLGISSPLDYDKEFVKDLSRKFKPSMTHIAEDKESRDKGDFEISLESDFDALIHGLYLNETDIEKLSERKIYMIFCPSSNLWHGIKFPQIDLFIKHRIKFGIGTDNASWFTPDVFREANLLLLYLRLNKIRGEDVAKELLKSLFIYGYETVRKSPRTIKEGNEAHFLLIDGYNSGILNSQNKYTALLKRTSESLKYRVDITNIKKIS